MRKTDKELEREISEALKPLLKKWDDDYINRMKALGYTEDQAWALVGRRTLTSPNKKVKPKQLDLFA